MSVDSSVFCRAGMLAIGLVVSSACAEGHAVTKLFATAPKPVSPELTTSATIALARDSDRTVAYVADEDERAILTVDVLTGEVLARTAAFGRPSSLLLAQDGSLFATVADLGVVRRYRAGGVDEPLHAVDEVGVAAEPLSLALDPGTALVVVSGWGRTVTELDIAKGGLATKRTVPVEAEPRAAIVANGMIWVTHAVGGRVTVVDREEAWSLSATMTERSRLRLGIRHGRGHRHAFVGRHVERVATHAHAWIPLSEKRILSPAVFVHSGPPTATAGYGGGRSAVVAGGLIDVRTTHPHIGAEEMVLSHGGALCTAPRSGAVTSADAFVIACDGLDRVVAYRMEAERVPVPVAAFEVGAGVTGVAYDAREGRAVAWSQIDRRLSILALPDAGDATSLSWDRPPALAHTIPAQGPSGDLYVERGRRLFHESSARISSDGRSCVSCHPGGRQDHLVWSSPSGPRQTPMLAGRLEGTAPFGWNGEAEQLRDHVGVTIQRLGGRGLPPDDLNALVAYVASMPGPTRIPVDDDHAVVARGRDLFESNETGCGSCHRSDRAYTHERNHVVLGDIEANAPSLRYVAGTAPYMHDGRYATLEQVLDGTDGLMGHTAHLSRDDRSALLAFLRTL